MSNVDKMQDAKNKLNHMISIGNKTVSDSGISATDMVKTMETLGISQKETKQFLWNEIVKYLKTNKWEYTNNGNDKYNGVDPALYKTILSARCASFFSFGFEDSYKSSKKMTDQDILRTIAGKNPLNLEKEVLCQAVKDLNEIHRIHLRKSIESCQSKLMEFSKINKNSDKDMETSLRKKLDKLSIYLRDWDKLSTYSTDNPMVCREKGCTNHLQTLHRLSKEILKTSDECSSQISSMTKTAKKANIEERERYGEEVSLWEKTKVYAGF